MSIITYKFDRRQIIHVHSASSKSLKINHFKRIRNHFFNLLIIITPKVIIPTLGTSVINYGKFVTYLFCFIYM